MPGAGSSRHEGPQAAALVQLAGAGLMLLGAFIPWIQSHALFMTIPIRGAETDYGRLFPAIALVVLAVVAHHWSSGWREWAHGLILLLGLIAVIVAVLYGVQVTQRVHRVAEANRDRPDAPLILGARPAFSVEFDVGYYVTLVGAGGLIAGAIMGLRCSRGQGG
jgi:hypothetical protein